MGIANSKIKQNLVFLMEPSEHEPSDDISLKGGNMILNRFCIDEDAAFELSGVNYLKKSSDDIKYEKSGIIISKTTSNIDCN